MRTRWLQLAAGIVAMVAVANLQYGWTLFVNPIHDRHGWSQEAIQLAFTLFVLVETWLVPFEAYLVDRLGPRRLVTIGGVLVALAWVVNAEADSLALLYLGAVLGGMGAGIVYGTSLGSALKWFPDRRGLACGLTAAAYGAGAALTVGPVAAVIRSAGYEAAFRYFGLGQGAVVVLAALALRFPQKAELPDAGPRTKVGRPERDCGPLETLRTPVFWLLYLMFILVATGGLMATAQLGPMSRDLKVSDVPLSLFGYPVAALTLALSLDRVMNGLARPFFGWISDRIGREITMFIAFTLEGVGILLLVQLARVPWLFVLLSGLTFFAWGEIFSLFPALAGDLFGSRYATTNYSLLYTAKGVAALLVPLGSWLYDITGSWGTIFVVAVAFDWTAALLAVCVLRPVRNRRGGEPRPVEEAV